MIVVTGASRGFGLAMAEAVANAGAHVVAVARTVGALEALDDRIKEAGLEAATLAPLDLTDGAMVDGLGAALFQRWGRLDGLVHAAGELGVLSPVAHIEPDVMEKTVALTLVGTHRLIRSLDPLLRAAPAGRAVFVTCSTGRPARPFWGAVGAPRAGMEALVQAYAAETATTSLRVNLYDPGPMRTRLRAQAYPGERENAVPKAEEAVAGALSLLGDDCSETGGLVVRNA